MLPVLPTFVCIAASDLSRKFDVTNAPRRGMSTSENLESRQVVVLIGCSINSLLDAIYVSEKDILCTGLSK